MRIIDIRTLKSVEYTDIQTISKNKKYLRVIGEEEEYSSSLQFIGIEVESRRHPHIYKLRESKWKLDTIISQSLDVLHGYKLESFDLTYNKLNSALKESIGLTKEGLDYMCYYIHKSTIAIINATCPLLCREAYVDGVNIEVSLLPISEKAYSLIQNELKLLLILLKELNFNSKQVGAGMHTHYSLASLGSNKEEISETIKKFLWFLYYNPYIMCIISNRHFEDSIYADMFYLINEDVALLTPSSTVKSKFMSIKDDMLNRWLEGKVSLVPELNIALNKKPKEAMSTNIEHSMDTLEFRWWASTNKFKRLWFNIMFSFRLLEFVKKTSNIDDLTFKNFYQFLIQSKDQITLDKVDKSIKKVYGSKQINAVC